MQLHNNHLNDYIDIWITWVCKPQTTESKNSQIMCFLVHQTAQHQYKQELQHFSLLRFEDTKCNSSMLFSETFLFLLENFLPPAHPPCFVSAEFEHV